ncbi:transposase, partial [Azospirillum brasilense]|nr:transposase [Azospirillum argentinense]
MGAGRCLMTKMRRSFTDEFKREAVALLDGSGRPLEHVARELGLQPSVLRNWRRAAQSQPPRSRSGAPAVPDAATPDEQAAEIARLRRELERARQERDILKRPSASSRKRRDEVPFRRGPPGRVPRPAHVHGARGVRQWVLRVAWAAGKRPGRCQPAASGRGPARPWAPPGPLWQPARACRPTGRGCCRQPGPGGAADA